MSAHVRSQANSSSLNGGSLQKCDWSSTTIAGQDAHEFRSIAGAWTPASFFVLSCTPGGAEEVGNATETGSETSGECQVGSLDCPCTDNGECLGALVCDEEQLCAEPIDPSGDGDGDGDGDGTYAGCEFYALKLPLPPDHVTQMWPVLFAVTNISEVDSTQVVIERLIQGQWTVVEGPIELGPLEAWEVERAAPADIVYWGVTEGDAFRVRSDTAVVVHQFTTGVDGASSLIPTEAWDWDYLALGRGDGIFENGTAHYAFVVAREDGTTVNVVLGPNAVVDGPGIPMNTMEGSEFQVQLDAGQTLGLFAASDGNFATITGTRVSSDPDHPIGVYVGFQGNGKDHNEDQLRGLNQWGSEYICPRIRWTGQNALEDLEWRTMSAQDATFVDYFSASLVGFPGSPAAFNVAGSMRDYDVFRSYRAVGTKPIGITPVLHYVNTWQHRRPSTAQLPSVDQLLDNYVIYVPDGPWDGHIVTTALPEAGEITIDGIGIMPIEEDAIIDGWIRQVFSLDPGVHVLSGSDPFLAIVNGYRSFGNYMYVAGGAID
jgi:hypothetical protein